MYSKNELIILGNLLKKYNHINIMSDDIYEKLPMIIMILYYFRSSP